MRGHQIDGHESTKTPAVNTDAGRVDIAQALKIFHAFHLIFHFLLSQMAECGLLKFLAAMLTASVVEDEE